MLPSWSFNASAFSNTSTSIFSPRSAALHDQQLPLVLGCIGIVPGATPSSRIFSAISRQMALFRNRSS